jgi:hypothetical protein
MKRIGFTREVLLVEIERRCPEPSCNARVRVGLTKAEALAYTGFECERCGRWCEDALGESDVPEWWEELKITSLEGLRPRPGADETRAEPGEVVERLSDAWQRRSAGARREDSEGDADRSEGDSL